MLQKGMKAPEFTLYNQEGKEVSLADYLGKKVVVYFYPKDDTSGCTLEAKGYAELHQTYLDQGIEVLGISKDSVQSHKKFANKHQLPFTLLADPELKAIQAYDVWQDKQMYGKTYKGIHRTTYVIDELGFIEHVDYQVNTKNNAKDILQVILEQEK